MRAITQAALKDQLRYDQDTGVFKWKINKKGGARAGHTAGHAQPGGYVIIGVFGTLHYAHRLAWLYVNGYTPEGYLDHINRDKHDNRIKNLREVSPTCNLRNSCVPATNKSGVRGVSWEKRRGFWQALIKVGRKTKFLGYYSDFDDAVCARLAGEQCLSWAGCDSSSSAFQHVAKFITGGGQADLPVVRRIKEGG